MTTRAQISGYDSVAGTVAEWKQIVPEPESFTGVIGSYGNGNFANTTAAKQAFPKAKHVVYDVNGSMPSCDLLDIEPGDAVPQDGPGWATRHNQTPGPHILVDPALYASASSVAQVISDMEAALTQGARLAQHISDMLDAGFKREQFLIQSAHYNDIPHICGPDTCGFPQADSGQYQNHGLKGQNTDLTLWMAHCFKAPRPKHDPHYGLFDNVERSVIGRNTERATVEEYDKWRATQTRTSHPHRARLLLLRLRCRILVGRLKRVLASEAKPHPNQVWRLRELQDRAAGKRLV